MSDMLKQAIIDANALKEAAVKNAETLLLRNIQAKSKIPSRSSYLKKKQWQWGQLLPPQLNQQLVLLLMIYLLLLLTMIVMWISLDLTALAKKIEADDAEEPEGSEMRDRDDIADDIAANAEDDFGAGL